MLRYLEVLKEQVNCCIAAFLVHAQCYCVLPVGAGLSGHMPGAGREVCSAGLGHTHGSLCMTGLMEPLLPQRGPGLWCLKLLTGKLTPLLEALCRLC